MRTGVALPNIKSVAVTISGPSGVGKSTVVKLLRDQTTAYIEDTTDNPYLAALVRGEGEFNAAANQRWFLERVKNFICHATPTRPLLIDQDPIAIVKVYAKMFRDEARINGDDYSRLIGDLNLIEQDLLRWRSPRLRIFLTADAETLRKRVAQRSNGQSVPPLDWYLRLNSYFADMCSQIADAVTISTEHLIAHQVSEEVSAILIKQT